MSQLTSGLITPDRYDLLRLLISCCKMFKFQIGMINIRVGGIFPPVQGLVFFIGQKPDLPKSRNTCILKNLAIVQLPVGGKSGVTFPVVAP